MNILELISKAHPQVRVEQRDQQGVWQAIADANALITKRSVGRDQIRGLKLEPGIRIVVREAARYFPAFPRGEGLFYAQSLTGKTIALCLQWWEQDRLLVETSIKIGTSLITVKPPITRSSDADLVLEVPATNKAPMFLGVHRLLDRAWLIARCKGRGVEIGPGPKPQVLPRLGVDVNYIEQATPEDWVRLYGKDAKVPVDPSLWKRYVVGNADQIPAQPESLDFIFSSHVVEHLANPLGHLKYWATLLRAGGVVAAVIPDLEGCKDFVFKPSSADELLQEYRDGDMQVKLHHYQRWGEHRMPKRDAAEIMASGRSIHVHFYTPASMRAVLDAQHRELGFRHYEVISSPNHKDFHVLLEK